MSCEYRHKTPEQLQLEKDTNDAWMRDREHLACEQLNEYIDKKLTPSWIICELEIAYRYGYYAGAKREKKNDKAEAKTMGETI